MTTVAHPAQVEQAMKAAATMDAMIGRLGYDPDFADALANNPRETLEQAGMALDKEALEAFIKADPERFDKACEALFSLVDSDFLHKLSVPTCA